MLSRPVKVRDNIIIIIKKTKLDMFMIKRFLRGSFKPV